MGHFEHSEINNLLFDEASGACVKLDKTRLDYEAIKMYFNQIDELWSVSGNVRNHTSMVNVNEKFIEWGCLFVSRLMKAGVFVDEADRLLDYMTELYDFLPVSSHIISNSFFLQDDLILFFIKLQSKIYESPTKFIDVFKKIWKFCHKEIVNEGLFCTIMEALCNMICNTTLDNFLEDLFDYGRFALKLHINSLGQKVDSILIINKCINLMRIVARTEKHATGRLLFWWQFMCSVTKETLEDNVDTCIIPFLSNLLGHYLTLNHDQKFGYTLSVYNCFTNRRALGPFCHFVMRQILTAISRSAVQDLPKLSVRYEDLVFKFRQKTIETFIEPFLMGFYYWCQFSEKGMEKRMPFHLLNTVCKVFIDRFLPTWYSKSKDCDTKNEPENINPSLYTIVAKCITIKNLLENDISSRSRRCDTIFSDHLGLLTSLVNTMDTFGANSHSSLRYRAVLLSLLCDNLSLVGQLMSTSQNNCTYIGANLCDQWLTNGQRLWFQLALKMSDIGPALVREEMHLISTSWLSALLREHSNIVTATPASCSSSDSIKVDNNKLWVANIRMWCLVSSTFIKNDLNLTYVKECDNLAPFLDYLRAPMLFLEQLDTDSMGRKDFCHLCDLHERLYHIFVIKAGFIPSISKDEWCGPLCALLGRHMSQSPYNGQALLLNFTARFLRLVVHYCDPIELDMTMMNHKKSPLWQTVKTLRAMLTKINLSNIRVALKESRRGKIILPTNELSVSLLMQLQSVGNGDMDFTLGVILSVTERLLQKLVHNESLTEKTLDKLCSSLPQIVTLVFKKRKRSRRSAQSKIDEKHHKTRALQVEEFLVLFVRRVRQSCKGESTMPLLKSLFQSVFACSRGAIARAVMSIIVQHWNHAIMYSKSAYDVDFTKEFVDNLKQAKLFYADLRLPRSFSERSRNIVATIDLAGDKENEAPGTSHHRSGTSDEFSKKRTYQWDKDEESVKKKHQLTGDGASNDNSRLPIVLVEDFVVQFTKVILAERTRKSSSIVKECVDKIDRTCPPGIMRVSTSASKKNARVSFSEPLTRCAVQCPGSPTLGVDCRQVADTEGVRTCTDNT